MALDQVKNFSKVTVSTGYDASALSIVLTTGHGAKLPDPATGAFNLVWWDFTTYPDPSDDPNVEIVRCTVRSTDTLTVTRAQEGTGASTKNTGGKVYKMILAPTAKMMTDIAPSVLASHSQNTDTGTNASVFRVLTIACSGIADLELGGTTPGGNTSPHLILHEPYWLGASFELGQALTAADQPIGESKIVGASSRLANTVNTVGGGVSIYGGNHSTTGTVEGSVGIYNANGTTPIITFNESNTMVNGATVGASAVGVVSIKSGTAPSTSPADAIQIWSADESAGNASLKIRAEGGTVTTIGTSIIMGAANSGITLKQGANGKCGTFVANGATPVTVSNTSIAITDTIIFSLNTVGGTVGLYPAIQTITAATGFTVACTALDTSTYNYVIISNAA